MTPDVVMMQTHRQLDRQVDRLVDRQVAHSIISFGPHEMIGRLIKAPRQPQIPDFGELIY